MFISIFDIWDQLLQNSDRKAVWLQEFGVRGSINRRTVEQVNRRRMQRLKKKMMGGALRRRLCLRRGGFKHTMAAAASMLVIGVHMRCRYCLFSRFYCIPSLDQVGRPEVVEFRWIIIENRRRHNRRSLFRRNNLITCHAALSSQN